MRRPQLEHVTLEVGRRNDLEYFYIIGSAANLAVVPDPPEWALNVTRDADVISPHQDDALSDRISRVLGESLEVVIEHGYYVQGVSRSTPAFAPQGREQRANPVRVQTRHTGLCMEPHDLVIGKLGAGREKDLEFARAVADLGILHRVVLLERLALVKTNGAHSRLIAARIEGFFSKIG